MSDCWNKEDYNEVLSFVENYLWLFVQQNATVHKPKQIVCNLAQISQSELRLLQIIYFLLSETVQKTVRESIPKLLRSLGQSSEKMIAETQGSVRGNVDWNLTLKRRFREGFANSTVLITRVSIKTYNMPEVQALKYILEQINFCCVEVLNNIQIAKEATYSQDSEKWQAQIRSLYQLSHNYLKSACLHNVITPTKITDLMLQKVRCARNNHFKSIYKSLVLYRKLFIQEEQETLKDCFSQGVLKPLNHDTLYELYILIMTMISFERAGWIRDKLKLIGYGKGAVAQYKKDDTSGYIYYQNLPKIFGENSIYVDIMRKYKIDVNLRRPDMILEFNYDNKFLFKLLEIKRTQNKQYIVDSFYKVLGYLKDFENSFKSETPHAMLVVWAGVESVADPHDAVVILNRRSYKEFIENVIIT